MASYAAMVFRVAGVCSKNLPDDGEESNLFNAFFLRHLFHKYLVLVLGVKGDRGLTRLPACLSLYLFFGKGMTHRNDEDWKCQGRKTTKPDLYILHQMRHLSPCHWMFCYPLYYFLVCRSH